MKNWNWQQWTAFAVACAVLVTELVLVFTTPFAAIWGAGGFVAGAVTAYLVKKNNVNNTTDNN